MFGTKAQEKLREAGIKFTTRNIYENNFHGTAIVFSSRYQAMKAAKLLGVADYWVRRLLGSKSFEIPYFS